MEKLTIMLVEDDYDVCERFEKIFDGCDDMSLLRTTNDAIQALEDIRDFLPSVVILDLELHHGRGSGLEVLKGLKESIVINPKPYTVITTNNISAVTYECARELGADYIFSKHQDEYSEENVVNFLRLMKTAILHRQNTSHIIKESEDTPAQRKKRIRCHLISEFNLIGISPKSVGYNYLIEAVELVIEEPRPNIHTLVGNMHGKTDVSVERAMQYAIKRAWKSGDPETLYKHYTARISPDKGFPTVTEFVYYYANKMSNEYDA